MTQGEVDTHSTSVCCYSEKSAFTVQNQVVRCIFFPFKKKKKEEEKEEKTACDFTSIEKFRLDAELLNFENTFSIDLTAVAEGATLKVRYFDSLAHSSFFPSNGH